MADIGIISDLHAPYQHTDAFDFIKAIKKTYKLDRWVCMGDENDFHGISFHDSDPDLFSPGSELKEAIAFHKDLAKIIPKMDLLESNHGSLVYRKQKYHGIPRHVFKSYQEILEVPKTWRWHFELTLRLNNGQHVYFHHGKNADVFRLSQAQGMCAVQGHYHEKFNIHYWSNSLGLWWGMQTGCLIDPKSYAFAYNKNNLKTPIIGTGIIYDSQPLLIPMVLNKRGRWVGRLM